MIIAELYGKLPSKLEEKEDILTSNVFSFLKYSDRQLLKEYLNLLGLEVTHDQSAEAEFNFWISYDDKTEPDLVIICGEFYILFEAKLHSDFSQKTPTSDHQIIREIKMGKLAAENIDKKFVYVAITAEYNKNATKYSGYEGEDFHFKWTNWQTFTNFIENKLTKNGCKRDIEFANDLYSLLLRKKLRSFKGFQGIDHSSSFKIVEMVFYEINSSKFVGDFSGFIQILGDTNQINLYKKFYHKTFFKPVISFEYSNTNNIFYNGKAS